MEATTSKLEVRTPIQARGARSVQAIRDAVLSLMRHHDVSSLTVAEIARQAKVGVGTFYHYYPSREALLLDVHGQLFAETAAALSGAFVPFVETPDQFIAALERLVVSWIEIIIQRRGLEQAVVAISYQNPEVAELLRKQAEPLHELVASLLAHYHRVLRPCDPRLAADTIVLLIGSLVGRAIRDDVEPEQPEPLVREAVRMVAHYILPDETLARNVEDDDEEDKEET